MAFPLPRFSFPPRAAAWRLTFLAPAACALLACASLWPAHANPPARPHAPRKATPAKAPTAPKNLRYAQHAVAMAFAEQVAQQHDLDLAWVRQQIGQAERLPSVIQLIAPPPSPAAKNWAAYRARFIEPVRLQAGVRFWLTHREALERAQAQYGVPAELVVGIIGVETLYGRHTGTFRVLDALATLAFDFPASHPRAAARTEYFQGELAQLLVLSQRSGVPPSQWRGSYAGAMGLPQFMPTSVARFGVDFDGDGRVDLQGSPVDAIGSVAHYLKAYGWQTGMPTHYPVRFDEATLDLDTLLAPDILPSFSVGAFEAKGARLDEDARRHPGLLALVQLHNGDPAAGGAPPSYVAGTENFYTVTRYNWSSYYALAVIELGQAVAREMTLVR
ncbi:lytic murein transglycosylase B [Hydrogenophaga sp. OTU3427]|uniref:lytic murein transglycosylase B n=1 Tax=Hydrogenophaga sp. OTU3427 TaxID=3043856 RepID=UPI00313C7D95